MKTIVPGNDKILKIITSLINRELPFKLSLFTIKCRTDDGMLLCNTLTGEEVLLTKAEELYISQSRYECDMLMDAFIQRGFIVPVDCDELKRVEQLRSIFRKQKEVHNVITNYNILPTTCCNARCFYCFEKGIKTVTMTEEVADQLVKFIYNHHGKSNTVRIQWFGGEPTIGKGVIDYICKQLKTLEIPYISDMVSNGYLFDKELVQHSKEYWNLRKIQITLDGTEPVYNKVKSYVGVNGSPYRRVLNNIRLFLDAGVSVHIRLNMDTHNADNLSELITELEKLFLGKENLIVYVHLLKESIGLTPNMHSSEAGLRLRKQYMQIRERLEKAGWRQARQYRLPKLRVIGCMADDPSFIQCSPDGVLGKCEDLIYEHTVGSLKEGITNSEEIERWKERDYFDACYSCPLVPSCFHTLKHCPCRIRECFADERNDLLEKISQTMQISYTQWKSKHVDKSLLKDDVVKQEGNKLNDDISTSISWENC